jgi:hypothetical protein
VTGANSEEKMGRLVFFDASVLISHTTKTVSHRAPLPSSAGAHLDALIGFALLSDALFVAAATLWKRATRFIGSRISLSFMRRRSRCSALARLR